MRLFRLPQPLHPVLVVLFVLLVPSCSRSEAPPAADIQQAVTAEPPGGRPPAVARQLVRSATLDVDVDSLTEARKKTETLVLATGGFVEHLESSSYPGSLRLELTLRTPKEKLDALLSDVRKLGRVLRESQAVEDVTRKYIDVDARLRNLQKTEQGLVALLERSHGGLADVLAVERELSRVREEVEVLDSEMRVLKEQVALSKLKVAFTQEGEPEPPPSVWTPWTRLFRNAGNIFVESFGALVGFAAWLVSTLMYLLPWSPVIALGLYALKRFWAFRKAREKR